MGDGTFGTDAQQAAFFASFLEQIWNAHDLEAVCARTCAYMQKIEPKIPTAWVRLSSSGAVTVLAAGGGGQDWPHQVARLPVGTWRLSAWRLASGGLGPWNMASVPDAEGMHVVCCSVGTASQEASIWGLICGELVTLVPFAWGALNGAVREIATRTVQQQFEEVIYRDDLTGLANYRFLQLLLHQELRRSRRRQQPFSLLFIDLDHFKAVNDQYGHLAGSDLLKKVGTLLKKLCRDSDMIARFGGDEFVIFLPATPPLQGEKLADRLRRAIATEDFAYQGHPLRLAASVGCAAYPRDGRDPETLLRRADELMYADKRRVRGAVSESGAVSDGSLTESRRAP